MASILIVVLSLPLAFAHYLGLPGSAQVPVAPDVGRTERMVFLDRQSVEMAASGGEPVRLDLGYEEVEVLIRENPMFRHAPAGVLDVDTYEERPVATGAKSYVGRVVRDGVQVTDTAVAITIGTLGFYGEVRTQERVYALSPAWGVNPEAPLDTTLVVSHEWRAPALEAGVLGSGASASTSGLYAHSVHYIILADYSYCNTYSDAGTRMQSIMNALYNAWGTYLDIELLDAGKWCLTGNMGGNDNLARLSNLQSWGQGYPAHRETLHMMSLQPCTGTCAGIGYGNDTIATLGTGGGYSWVYYSSSWGIDMSNGYYRAILACHETGHNFAAGHSYYTAAGGYYGCNAAGYAMNTLAVAFDGVSSWRVDQYAFPQLAGFGH